MNKIIKQFCDNMEIWYKFIDVPDNDPYAPGQHTVVYVKTMYSSFSYTITFYKKEGRKIDKWIKAPDINKNKLKYEGDILRALTSIGSINWLVGS